METKLNNNQKQALHFFEKYNYVVVEAPRQSGKTFFLQEIIKRYTDFWASPDFPVRIGVKCRGGISQFRRDYERFKNCEYIDEDNKDEWFDLTIGDEFFIEPIPHLASACARTLPHFTHRWDCSSIPVKELKKEKERMPEHIYEQEFGQYIK